MTVDFMKNFLVILLINVNHFYEIHIVIVKRLLEFVEYLQSFLQKVMVIAIFSRDFHKFNKINFLRHFEFRKNFNYREKFLIVFDVNVSKLQE